MKIDKFLIVGGGLSGLTMGFLLSRRGIDFRLIESADRLGGRVWTTRFNSEVIERGGELINSTDRALLKVASHLGVQVNPVEPNSPIERKILFEGYVLDEEKLTKDISCIYSILHRNFKNIFLDKDIIAARDIDGVSIAAYLEDLKITQDLKSIISALFSSDYGADPAEISALHLVANASNNTVKSIFDLLGNFDESLRIEGGMDLLVSALASSLKGEVSLSSRLTCVDDFRDGLVISIENSHGDREECVQRMFLTTPISSLHGIHFGGSSGQAIRNIEALCGYGVNRKRVFKLDPASSFKKFGSYRLHVIDSPWSGTLWSNSNGRFISLFQGGIHCSETVANVDIQNSLRAFTEDATPTIEEEVLDSLWDKDHLGVSFSFCPPSCWVDYWKELSMINHNDKIILGGEHTSRRRQGYMGGAIESAFRAARIFCTN